MADQSSVMTHISASLTGLRQDDESFAGHARHGAVGGRANAVRSPDTPPWPMSETGQFEISGRARAKSVDTPIADIARTAWEGPFRANKKLMHRSKLALVNG